MRPNCSKETIDMKPAGVCLAEETWHGRVGTRTHTGSLCQSWLDLPGCATARWRNTLSGPRNSRMRPAAACVSRNATLRNLSGSLPHDCSPAKLRASIRPLAGGIARLNPQVGVQQVLEEVLPARRRNLGGTAAADGDLVAGRQR